ncbi:hypothetical protein AWN76_002400 [Rhodothermaceae bacterium RA]|nr:hypothetical protein AWN76_002400 [Rhodothermaceae bacterium RA]
MPTPASHRPLDPPDPQTPCTHCGLPVGRHPVGEDPWFCCTGCRTVYETLRAAGFDEAYYRLRGVAERRPDPQPARTDVDALVLSEVDSAAFLEEHTRVVTPGVRRVQLYLDGVHCAACVWLVERMPQEVPGVLEARLDLPRARLDVTWQPEAVRLSDVVRWLAGFGYVAHPVRRDASARRSEAERRLLVKVGVCWALAGNVMLIAFALYAGLDVVRDPALAGAARWLSLLLAVPAVLYGGSEFFRRAWASVRRAARSRDWRRLHMDTPIALGILVGFADSTAATVTGRGEVWFDSITVLVAALLTARWLQMRSRRLAGDATERLLALMPSMARRLRPDGAAETVRVEDLAAGDRVLVPAGEVLPVDGVVDEGASTVNNAVLTGESRPVPVEPGDAVQAGATNLSAPLTVRVDAAGDATRVGRLLAWVREAADREAPVVLLADRIGGYFVLAVLALAGLTALLWAALAPSEIVPHVVALLVITCPCALGMATPLAMAVAAGRAARIGIFIKTDAALEHLTRLDTIILDKTGTLTEGTLALVDVDGDAGVLDLAAALEAESAHPIAQALVRAAGACAVPGTPPATPRVTRREHVLGQGVRGEVDGRPVCVGRPPWVAAQTKLMPAARASAVARFAEQGYTPVAVAVDGRVVAVLAFGDRLRADSRRLVASLHAWGKAVYILSGDHPQVVQAVADALGVPRSQVHGHVSPEGKQAFVEDLRRARAQTIAMVGDGVNDAIALQAADVGIAVQGGSTASLVAADVFLTRSGLQPVLDLLRGADRSMRLIRRNLAFSLAYNLAGATAAMAGLVSPLVAAVAMPISSLIVVTSSILQPTFRPHTPDADEAAVASPPAAAVRPAA